MPPPSSRRRLALIAFALAAATAPSLGQTPTPPVVPPAAPAQPVAPPFAPPPAPTPQPAATGRTETRTLTSPEGVELTYGVSIPAGFKSGDAAPVIIVLPPGDQSWNMVTAALSYFQPRCETEGWVIVSPAAPMIAGKATDFTGEGAKQIPALIKDLRTWIRPEGNRFHLAGISRGGISAFHVAPMLPREFLSITVFPGFPRGDDVKELGKLTGIPIRALVGNDDSVAWHDGAKLMEAEAKKLKLDLKVSRLPAEGHIIRSLAEGKILDVIAPFRAKEATLDAPRSAITLALDDFHDAASKAEEARYFAHFAPEGVFIGTDASERWTVEQFRAYARPIFLKGKGWTYTVRSRNIELSPDKSVAWFDEALDNEKYGRCRGTGVLRLDNGKWLITQYHLTVPVPNELLERVANMIRSQPKTPARAK